MDMVRQMMDRHLLVTPNNDSSSNNSSNNSLEGQMFIMITVWFMNSLSHFRIIFG